MHLYAVIEMTEGSPDIDTNSIGGFSLAAGPIGNYGLYLVAGTASQLVALNASPNVFGLCVMTSSGIKWAELDVVISATRRTKINTWLSARGYPNIPVGWTYKQVLLALIQRMKRINDGWDLDITWVQD